MTEQSKRARRRKARRKIQRAGQQTGDGSVRRRLELATPTAAVAAGNHRLKSPLRQREWPDVLARASASSRREGKVYPRKMLPRSRGKGTPHDGARSTRAVQRQPPDPRAARSATRKRAISVRRSFGFPACGIQAAPRRHARPRAAAASVCGAAPTATMRYRGLRS